MNHTLTSHLFRLPHWRLPRATLSTELLALIASVFFVLACNHRFWAAAMAGRDGTSLSTWTFGGAMLIALTGLHFLFLCLVFNRWSAKPLLSILILATAFATYYMQTFSVFLDPPMLRSVFATELKESRDLLVPGMALHLALHAGLPLLLLSQVQIKRRSLSRSFLIRLAAIAGTAIVTVGAVLLMFQDLSSLMRNQKELRYLITPANFIYSSVRVLTAQSQHAGQARLMVGADAHVAPAWKSPAKPMLFVMVVGETARAANWGLNGYARQTTPQLAALNVINFNYVTSCGTDTETSLPCMFSSIGRRDYDGDRIRNSDSLLHLLARAGFEVIWRDNNTGCKGVCADFTEERVDRFPVPGICEPGRCLDETLLHGMQAIASDAKGNLFVVLHQLGNHGPSYYKRYPEEFRRFTPTCDTPELRQCDRQQIVNSYDNAILYTDHFLAKTIGFLRSQESRYDTALLYASDHGESLGENGLYLHGIPYAIAPKVQKEVPMILWLSADFLRSSHLDEHCLRERAKQPASHDHLFHSLLSMVRVETGTLDPALDLSRGCRLPMKERQGLLLLP